MASIDPSKVEPVPFLQVAQMTKKQCQSFPKHSLASGFKRYELQWPSCEVFVLVMSIATKHLSHPTISQDYLPRLGSGNGDDQNTFPPTMEGFIEAIQAFNLLYEAWRVTAEMTALVNDLAVGRKKLDATDAPLIPIIRLRSADAFLQSEKERGDTRVEEDMAYRAREYRFEYKWLSKIVVRWKDDTRAWRIKHDLNELTLKVDYFFEKTLHSLRREVDCMRLVWVDVEDVPCHPRPLRKVKLVDLAKHPLMAWTKEYVEVYEIKLKEFAGRWKCL